MKKPGSAVNKKSAFHDVVITTTDPDGANVVNVTLRVSADGRIVEMFGVGEGGQKWSVQKIKLSLRKTSGEPADDNDECKCCEHDPPPNGPIRCVTCSC